MEPKEEKEGQNAQLTLSATIYSPYCMILGHLSGARGKGGEKHGWSTLYEVDSLGNLGSVQVLCFIVYIDRPPWPDSTFF